MMTKADLIRSFPPQLPAAEVVARAKKKKVKLTVGHVYVVRAKDRQKRGGTKAAGRPKGGSGAMPKPAQRLLKAVIKDLLRLLKAVQ